MALVTNVIEGSAAERVLLLLHGYGADERDLGGLLPYLDPEGKFVTVLPRGPMAAPPGFSWFDVMSQDADAVRTGVLEALEILDDLLDTACEERGMSRAESVVAGFSQGGGLAFALAHQRSDQPHPAGVLVMSPFARLELVGRRLGRGARHPGARAARHRRPDDQRAANSRDLAEMLTEHGVPVIYAEFPMGHEVALESVQQARTLARRGARGREPVGATARTAAGKPGEGGDDGDLRDRGPAVGRARDRRLLGAVVRTVPPGRSDRRADRRDAPGCVQGGEGEHRRGARARAARTTCRASRSSDCSATGASSAPRSAPSRAPSSKPSSACSSSPDFRLARCGARALSAPFSLCENLRSAVLLAQ